MFTQLIDHADYDIPLSVKKAVAGGTRSQSLARFVIQRATYGDRHHLA